MLFGKNDVDLTVSKIPIRFWRVATWHV